MPLCCYSKKFLPETAKISKQRLLNLVHEFHWINWDLKTIKVTYVGLGDQPAFKIEGKFLDKFNMIWYSHKPGGAVARLHVYRGKVLIARFRNATYTSSKELERKINKLAKDMEL
jgi:hypothetical protein